MLLLSFSFSVLDENEKKKKENKRKPLLFDTMGKKGE